MISEAFIEELKDRTDIESIVGSYVQLKRRGGSLIGLCPFHSEKTPSFTVSPERGFFHCFGCGAGGDVITFIRKIENLEYVEAVRFLCERAGMSMPEDDSEANNLARLKQRIFELNRMTARFFHATLLAPQGAPGLEYLRRRGLSDKTIRHFGLGFAPNGWDLLQKHLRAAGYSEYELDAAKVVVRTRKGNCIDMFRNRVVFPIIDTRGNVVAFGARAMGDEQPKYLNTADTPVFKKSRNLFALNFAKGTPAGQPMILAEGYMDVVALHAAGFTSAVATLGTALTAEQARMLANYTKEIILAYDADAAGRNATRRAAGILDEVGLRVRVLRMEGAKDPDEYIKTFGPLRFGKLLAQSAGAVEYQLSALREGRDLDDPAEKVAYLKEAAKLLAGLQSPLERDLYAGRLAEQSGRSKDALLATIDSYRKRSAREQRRQAERELVAPVKTRGNPLLAERRGHEQQAVAEDCLLRLLYRHPDLLPRLDKRLGEEDFVTPFNRRLYTFMTQRLRQNSTLDPTAFAAAFSVDEMGQIAALFQPDNGIEGSMEDLDRYIDILQQAKGAKTDSELVAMDPRDIQDYITRKASSQQST